VRYRVEHDGRLWLTTIYNRLKGQFIRTQKHHSTKEVNIIFGFSCKKRSICENKLFLSM